MSAFLDTNILVYAQGTGPKADKARAILAAGGTISVQVLNEFAAVLSRKFGKGWDEIGAAVDDTLALVDDVVPLTLDTHAAARALAASGGLSFYDALIVAAAKTAGASKLVSEDMPDGRRFGALVVENPFKA